MSACCSECGHISHGPCVVCNMSDEHCLAVMNAEYDEHPFDCDDVDCPTCTPIAIGNFVAAIAESRQDLAVDLAAARATIVALQAALTAAVATWEHHRATATKLAEALEGVLVQHNLESHTDALDALVAWHDGQTT